jgi:hypothetical protein
MRLAPLGIDLITPNMFSRDKKRMKVKEETKKMSFSQKNIGQSTKFKLSHVTVTRGRAYMSPYLCRMLL